MDISGIILAYNEEENISDALTSLRTVLSTVASKWEIVVVLYEGSTDKTREIVLDFQKKDTHIKLVIQKKTNKGYGGGLRKGIASAKYSHIFYTDGDNQFDMKEIKRLIPYLSTYDIVSGYRKNRKDSIVRRIYAWCYNELVCLVFFRWFKDIDCAFKIYHRRVFEKFTPTHNSGIIDAEIYMKASTLGFRIKEISVQHFSRDKGETRFASKAGFIKNSVVMELLKDIFRLKKEVSQLK